MRDLHIPDVVYNAAGRVGLKSGTDAVVNAAVPLAVAAELRNLADELFAYPAASTIARRRADKYDPEGLTR